MSKFCMYCGMTNPDTESVCLRCQKPLNSQKSAGNNAGGSWQQNTYKSTTTTTNAAGTAKTYCTNCGAELGVNQKFCGSCGAARAGSSNGAYGGGSRGVNHSDSLQGFKQKAMAFSRQDTAVSIVGIIGFVLMFFAYWLPFCKYEDACRSVYSVSLIKFLKDGMESWEYSNTTGKIVVVIILGGLAAAVFAAGAVWKRRYKYSGIAGIIAFLPLVVVFHLISNGGEATQTELSTGFYMQFFGFLLGMVPFVIDILRKKRILLNG